MPKFHVILDHDDFGLNQSKIMNVIDSKSLERDAGGKPGSTFPHPALVPGHTARHLYRRVAAPADGEAMAAPAGTKLIPASA
jgi:hypothetical protein